MDKIIVSEQQINITASAELSMAAKRKFNDVEIEMLSKYNLVINKKQFYAYLLKKGLENFNEKDLVVFVETSINK